MLTFLATTLSLIGVFLLQDNGLLTRHKTKQVVASVILIFSAILFGSEYGVLRGIFIFIGIISLLGTLFTLLRYKLDKA
ncbi:hypothetical protein HII17_14665 [Thalassotalea sp. M1531]|uniref:Permease n=1 Tax=Thalassotalea algicola TaxID=2716224 RepID=A0A7Y0Q823_9GAMM|nr:hypothetical protein [Thalassotalea algicola]NMP32796.1 hypothetical protein [Thalassotalea algicola]